MTFEERVQAVANHGFTQRQAGFLTTVMLHAGVCLGRQYCAYAGIVRGQKVHDFFNRLVADRYATVDETAHRKTRLYHVHAKALYSAIGEPNNRHRRPVVLSRAIERLMVLDAVLGDRQFRWLATEREKVAHFIRVTQLSRSELPHLIFGVKPNQTIRYFPDKLPIGIDPDGRRHAFVYLATRSAPIDFRVFLHRHASLLGALPTWTIRLLIPRHLVRDAARYKAAARDELSMPLRPATVDELRWYFEQRRDAASDPAIAGDVRYHRALSLFGAPRFRVLYRTWRRYGNSVLNATLSPVTADALSRRAGEVRCHVLPHTYEHLSTLVSTS